MGAIVSALFAATSFGFNTFSVKPDAHWSLIAFISILAFIGFVSWGWVGSEMRARKLVSGSPNIIFAQWRESPFFNPTNNPTYHGLQVWFLNKPKTSTEDSIAKDVTAKVTFYDRASKKPFDVYGAFVVSPAYDNAGYTDITNKLDSIATNDEPHKLQIALKWQSDDSAYAFAKETLMGVATQDGREKLREIRKGKHYVKITFSGTRLNTPSFWFELDNPGQNGSLSLSSPIKKPNLRKEGFGGE
jgi:hypothetical protein